jgi:uncharacterized protein (DUF1778 family)
MKTERLELPMTPEDVRLAERAAKISGDSKTAIMRRGGLQEARRIIAAAKQPQQ